MEKLETTKEPTKAAFYFEDFRFTEAHIIFSRLDEKERQLKFDTSGTYDQKKGVYDLAFTLTVYDKEVANYILKTTLVATFKFNSILKLEELPTYFYRNCIAIVYPYVRAFASNISLQANTGAMILLPTMNLSSLEKDLRDHTKVIS